MTIDLNTGNISLTTEFREKAATSRKNGKASPRLSFRLSHDELAELKAKAGRLSVSAYVRKRLFGEKGSRRIIRPSPSTGNSLALARVLGLLGKSEIAGNLKTLAAEARTGSLLLDKQTLDQIEEACRNVSRMRDELVTALDLREGHNR